MESSPVDAIRVFVLLVTAASVMGVVAGRIRLPYAVGLVLLGLAAGYVLPEAARGITPDLVLAVLLPGLIFEASFRTPLEPFRWAVSRVVVLAVPGVILTALVVAVVVHLGTGISLGSGLLVGAMVCATDPASVVSTFRRVAAPDRLRTLVEGESLLNDGTSLVIFVVALRIVTGGLGAGDAAIFFVTTLAISALIGGVLGFVTVQVLRTVDDHVLEATITIACAYGAAVIADGLGESGIIATAVAGLVVGTYGRRVALSAETEQALDEVWEVAAFVLAALIFLVVGAAIPLPRLLADAGPVAVGVVAVLVARLLTVYGLLGLGERVIERARRGRPSFASSFRAAAGARWSLAGPEGPSVVPLAWLHVLSFAGLRGSVTVALALALPAGLPDRAAVQTLTFGIVVVTLLVFGLLAGPFVSWVLGRAPAEPGDGAPATTGGGTPATPGGGAPTTPGAAGDG
jgi:monovalent cation:H+ antiporter, CPA1 family